MLQIAANPYVTILGPERTASSRLNLAQAFNSLGTTTGPLIGGFLIFQYFAKTGAHGAESVKIPYLMFCIGFLILVALVVFLIHLPHVGEGKVEAGIGALKYPHVVLGVLAIFMYVGGEVSIGSAIINYLGQPNVAAMSAIDASKYVSLFWGGMLIGRFMASVELSEMKTANKQILPRGYLSSPDFYCFGHCVVGTPTRINSILPPAGQLLKIICHCSCCFAGCCFTLRKALAGRTLIIFCATIGALLIAAMILWRTYCHVVHCWRGIIHVHWLAERFFRWRSDGMGALKKSGLIAARHGRCWWRGFAVDVMGQNCGYQF